MRSKSTNIISGPNFFVSRPYAEYKKIYLYYSFLTQGVSSKSCYQYFFNDFLVLVVNHARIVCKRKLILSFLQNVEEAIYNLTKR
jgi:hypothetical protein